MKYTAKFSIMLGLVGAATLAGCGSSGPVMVPGPSGSVVVPVPNQSVFLRASFDDDPSTYVGRFLPDDLSPALLDENQAATTRCSEFITTREVRASGDFDEVMTSSSQVGASLGVFPVGGGSAGAGSTSALRVKYQLTKKIRAEVTDPAALDQCCKAAPDQCAKMIIGEFYYGSGHVFQAAGNQSDFDASAITPEINAGLEFKDAIAWKRVTRFEDVYFAFRTQNARLNAGEVAMNDAECTWAQDVPSSLDGQYFVGVSDPSTSKRDAHDSAMSHARIQAIRYLGEYITSATSRESSSFENYLDNREAVQAMSKGLARHVKSKKWCAPETEETPAGMRYTVRVLAFFPKDAQSEAAKEAIHSLSGALKAQGNLTPQDARKFDTLADAIK